MSNETETTLLGLATVIQKRIAYWRNERTNARRLMTKSFADAYIRELMRVDFFVSLLISCKTEKERLEIIEEEVKRLQSL